ALAAIHGDRLLSDIVQTIDETPPASRSRARLVRAHRIYRDAREHYGRTVGASDDELKRSSTFFAPTHSPMFLVARYYSANAAFDRSRVERARRMLEGVIRDSAAYPSLNARAEKALGLYY